MPVKSFKFVSPGVFINEIDNSFRPRRPEAIGPVIVGRATRGLSMQPVKLESFSDFLTMYGGTVPGNAGGDVYRDGNFQSPMYGTYAARAFLNASVAPVTYVRLLGSQHTSATAAGKAGWQTTENPDAQTFASLTLSIHEAEAAGSAALIVTASGGSEVYRVSFNTDATTSTFTAGTPNSGNIDTDGDLATQISELVTLFDSIDNYNAHSASTGILIRSDVGLNHASFNIFTGSTTNTIMLTGSSVDGAGTLTDNGGAYGLWVFPSSSNDTCGTGGDNTDNLGSGILSSVWYLDQDSSIRLSGTLANSAVKAEGIGMVIESDASGLFTATIKGSKIKIRD